jgi:manganese efflux pump family protein
MSFWLLTLTALALSMDAFAVSVSCGISGRASCTRIKIILAAAFGIFQGLMPALGYTFSSLISGHIEKYSGFIAFLILSLIGGHMIIESFSSNADKKCELLNYKRILILAIATSIDAFATGISFGLLDINIFAAAVQIAAITFIVSLIGAFFGEKIGIMFKRRAEMAGGIILILIGMKVFIENLLMS